MKIRKRIGHFLLSKCLIENDYKAVQKVMAECVVIRCEMLYHKDSFDYIALSELFDEVDEGCEVPFYEIVVDKDLNISFQKRE